MQTITAVRIIRMSQPLRNELSDLIKVHIGMLNIV